jgi:glutamate/tyrosine decarboxylase-like PLP-dependent enzyme
MLQLSEGVRRDLWHELVQRIEEYQKDVATLRVAPELDVDGIRKLLSTFTFETPRDPLATVRMAADGLTRWQVHTPHPRYFGLFNPRPTTMGIAADTLVATFNPQMAAWSHNPFAAEVEAHLVREFGRRFGYPRTSCDGTFASGGMEANHTAVLAALVRRFPAFADLGLRSVEGDPVMYISSESHHSFMKAARLCGLGTAGVRVIGVDEQGRLRLDELERTLRDDCRAGRAPFLLVGTAGTTNSGAVDPLRELAELARREEIWFHVDAAWGGAAVIVPELAPMLDGVELADSITFDAHKLLSVPMGAGLFLTQDTTILDRTFRVTTAYMPKEAAGLDVVDPHLHSMQWSRRFIGLKVFLSLAVAGWDGYAAAIRHQVAMARLLAERLRAAGWEVVADHGLGVVCFAAPGGNARTQQAVAMHVVASGDAWISTTTFGPEKRTVLRACVTNYGTAAADIDALVRALEGARRSDLSEPPR